MSENGTHPKESRKITNADDSVDNCPKENLPASLNSTSGSRKPSESKCS
jgi:hypothetical protein